MTEAVAEPDRVGQAPHPRETAVLFGQSAAEHAFLQAEASGRLHHAWLISGPRGVGKATLGWRIARHLIAGDDQRGLLDNSASLEMAPDHPVFRRCAALGEPRLALIRRAADPRTGRLRSVIDVEEIRRLRGFLQLSATDGGWRAVIIDAADDLNVSSANALLKFLEEPPARVVFLLVSHQPALLLPTIRSRCRSLRCTPLDPPELARALSAAGEDGVVGEALGALAQGSVGEALRLLADDGLTLYTELCSVLNGLPRLDRFRALELVRRGSEARRAEHSARILDLIVLFLGRMARAGATGGQGVDAVEGEKTAMERLCPGPEAARIWAQAASDVERRGTGALAVHLDPTEVIFDTLLELERAARRIVHPA